MHAFAYERPEGIDAALAAAGPEAAFLAGGTNLLDLMKCRVAEPARVVDINRLPLAQVRELPGGGLRIGALARNSDCARHALVASRFPLLSQALLAGASPQLRNMATIGGNLMQRTRCPYFMDVAFAACNKRKPGSGCGARAGRHRNHAIFGASEGCIATHPSDMAVALAALDATVELRGGAGTRSVAVREFHRLPGTTPEVDTRLAPGELIVAIELPANGFARRCHYLKVRDRATFAFALVSVAAAVELEGDVVRAARIALGGVAHKPWRADDAESLLVGRRLDAAAIEAAACAAVQGATPLRDNVFKVELARRSVARALAIVARVP